MWQKAGISGFLFSQNGSETLISKSEPTVQSLTKGLTKFVNFKDDTYSLLLTVCMTITEFQYQDLYWVIYKTPKNQYLGPKVQVKISNLSQ